MDDLVICKLLMQNSPHKEEHKSCSICVSENHIMNNLENEKIAKIIVSSFLCVGIQLCVSGNIYGLCGNGLMFRDVLLGFRESRARRRQRNSFSALQLPSDIPVDGRCLSQEAALKVCFWKYLGRWRLLESLLVLSCIQRIVCNYREEYFSVLDMLKAQIS